MNRLKKKVITLLMLGLTLALIGLPLFQNMAYAQTFPDQPSFENFLKANTMPILSQGGKTASYQTYNKYQLIVYGLPKDTNPNTISDIKCTNEPSPYTCTASDPITDPYNANVEYRYLGYTQSDQLYSNPQFPPDVVGTNLPEQWQYITVSNASISWASITDPNQYQYTLVTPLQGDGATTLNIQSLPSKEWSGDPYPSTNSQDFAQIQSAPTWISNGSVYTQNHGTDGKTYYATFTIPAMVGSVLVNGSLTTNDGLSSYTIGGSQQSISVPITVTANAKLNQYVTTSQVADISATYGSETATHGKKVGTVQHPSTVTFDRNTYSVGTHTITLTGTVSIQSTLSVNDTQTKPVTKAITLNVLPVSQYNISGDFSISKNPINYRDSFSVQPTNISITGGTGTCSYVSHVFKLSNGSTSWTSPTQTSQTQQLSFSYPSNYPPSLSVGNVNVSMQITTTCGMSTWISHSLTVNGPANNNPPYMELGWFHSGDHSSIVPVTEVVQGTKMDFRIINDPSHTPPSPSDPDGDSFSLTGWDFNRSSTWVTSLPGKYGFNNLYNELDGITMDTTGYHMIYGTLTDQFGASYTTSAMIHVIPPNPIPIAICPTAVKENRPVPASAFDASQSYSPVSGRTIDHTKDQWTNKLSSYTNGTTSDIKVQASLNVFDSTGLKSLSPSTCNLTVHPDLPPIAKLDVLPLAMRNQTVHLYNHAYSPDGDTISSIQYMFKYDANNNGFDDDPWQNLAGNLTSASFTPLKVGKYLFYEKVTENYGKWADTLSVSTSSMTMDVINLAPTVSFQLAGQNNQPSLSTPTAYSPTSILNNWDLYQFNSTKKIAYKGNNWSTDGGLSGGLGKNFERQYYDHIYTTWWNNNYRDNWVSPYHDDGYGANNLNPYRAINNSQTTNYIEGDKNKTTFIFDYGQDSYYMDIPSTPSIRSNKTDIYYDRTARLQNWAGSSTSTPSKEIFALNKQKITTHPYTMTLGFYTTTYDYPNGSPYDFVIDQSSEPTMQYTQTHWGGGYYNHEVYVIGTSSSAAYPRILAYEMSDRTIYTVVQYRYISDYGRYKNPYNGKYYNWKVYKTVNQIVTFDAYTGQLLAQSIDADPTFQSQWPVDSVNQPIAFLHGTGDFYAHSDGLYLEAFNKNDDMIFFDHINNKAYEFNQLGKMVKSFTLPASPGNVTSPIYKGVNGEFYYEAETYPANSNHMPIDAYVVKLNPDLTLGWKVKLTGGTYNNYSGYTPDACFVNAAYSPGQDNHGELVINPMKNKIYARSFYEPGYMSCANVYQSIDMTTGQLTVLDSNTYNINSFRETFQLDWNGNVGSFPDSMASNSSNTSIMTTKTADNYYTNERNDNSYPGKDNLYTPSWAYNGFLQVGASLGFGMNTNKDVFGSYFGDGIYVSLHPWVNMGYTFPGFAMTITTGPPTTAPLVTDRFDLGQFVSKTQLADAELNFNLKMHKVHVDNDLAGFSFRMQNPQNHYAVETDGSTLYLTKYQYGNRMILKSIAYPFQDEQDVAVKVTFVGNQLSVSVNGVPYLSATDKSFATGTFGPFSKKSYVMFSGMYSKPAQSANVQWSNAYAIWDNGSATATVQYSGMNFTDPENDPMAGSFEWTYQHTPMFLNNQGVSVLNGKTFSTGVPTFDKVGKYVVTLKAKDDPNPSYLYPNMTFDSYRKASNAFTQTIIVHRRPIANYSLSTDSTFTAIWNGFMFVYIAPTYDVLWNDTSYDPDRYDPTTGTSSIGLNYATNHGIYERKYYYITPSGVSITGKLVSPTETGVYTVGESVKDEYGSWSEWVTKKINITTPAAPNLPPTAGFNVNSTSTYRGVIVNVTSTASDPEDGTNISYQYYVKNLTTGSPEILLSSLASFPTMFTDNGTMQIRQVVLDSLGQSDQVVHNVTIANRKPVVSISNPTSTNQNNPTVINTNPFTISWNYFDADNDPQAKYRVKIYQYGGTLVADSNEIISNATSWSIQNKLTENQNMYAVVSVFDGYDWVDSTPKYFKIVTNQPPTANFTWNPQPVWEGDTINIVNQSTDPNLPNDTLTYNWTIQNPSGITTTSTLTNPSISTAVPGDYTVTLITTDSFGAADTKQQAVVVVPLTIQATVNHTTQWLQYHQSKNHQTSKDPKDFYSGENILVQVQSAPTSVKEVKAWIDATDMAGEPLQTEIILSQNGSTTHYEGVLYDKQMMTLNHRLRDGINQVYFHIVYTNGIVKETMIPINILGSVYQTAGVHRVR